MGKVFLGQIVHSKSFDCFEVIPYGFVAVQLSDGKITAVGTIDQFDEWKKQCTCFYEEIRLSSTQFLMPGFIDCHIHASQMPNIGLGLDKPLMEWLEHYTFPMESQYGNEKFAREVYEKVVATTIRNGTTLAVYFATNHKKSSIILAEEVARQGQRAFVGKVCSDCNCPPFYVETSSESIKETQDFVQSTLALNSDLVQPIITPRFAISCTKELMLELAKIAKKYNLNIQSHISENIKEVELIHNLFGKMYAEVYQEVGLLSKKTIMAHGVHLESAEIKIFKETGAAIAHCPSSNTGLLSGLCDVQRLISAGIKVGLGTDVSGGNRASVHDTLLRTIDVSNHIKLLKSSEIKGSGKVNSCDSECKYQPITYKQAFYLSTLGGAEALDVANKVGNFTKGKEFDALIIETNAFPIEEFQLPEHLIISKSPTDKLLELVQKFIYVGDDRNILNVFVKGRKIK